MIADAVLSGWIVLVAVWFFAPYLGLVVPEPVGRSAFLLVLIGSVVSAALHWRKSRGDRSAGVRTDA